MLVPCLSRPMREPANDWRRPTLMGRAFLTVLVAAALLVSGCTTEGSSPSEGAASAVEQSPSSQPAGAVTGDLFGWPLDTVDCADAFRVATYDIPAVEVDTGAITSIMVCRTGIAFPPQTLTPDNPAWGRVVNALAAPPPTDRKPVACLELFRDLRSLALVAVTGQGALVLEVAEDACGFAHADIAKAFRQAGIPLVRPTVP